MKKIFLVLGIVLGIIILAGGIFYFSYFSSGPLAVLSIDSGTAQFKAAGDWQNAKSGMALKQGYSIKTLEDSAASILFSNSVFRMDENTEISLNELAPGSVSISQKAGKTWTKLLKISGITKYDISTPDAIATVRGTSFSVEVGNETRIAVVNGSVVVQIAESAIQEIINASHEATVNGSGISESEINLDDWIKNNIGMDEEYRAELKAKLIEKYSTLYSIAKKQGLSEEEINSFLDEWLDGKISVKEAIENGDIPESVANIIPPELKKY